MRNSSLIFIILFSIPVLSQDYVPMLDEGKTWNMQRTAYMVPPDFTTEIIYFSYFIESTQIINSQEYFVLKNNGDGEIIHYLREDVNTKIVYEYFTETQTELILFDFNATVGDVFNCTFQINGWLACEDNGVPYTNIVSEIGTISIYGINTKYFNIDIILDENNEVFGTFTVIEGVGFSNSGLFNHHCPYPPTDLPEYNLLSMNSMGIDNIKKNKTVSISFQKSTSQLVLKKANTAYKLQLYSITGKKVVDSNISDFIDISQLKKGVYIYHLTSDDTTTTGKVIIY